MPKLHHATSVPITLRIGRVAHALAADAAEIDGRSLNNELLHLIELGLGVRAKQEIVRKAMTRDPKPPPIRMRVNPHDPYSPIARLPGQTYPGDPLVKRPKRPTPGAGGSGRGAFDVNGGAFDVNSKTGINPGINPKTGIPRGQGAQAFYESIEPPTDEELASLGDEVDTPWDEDDDPDPAW